MGIKGLLSYSEGVGAFWIPDVLLTRLSAGLWQVLVFWASRPSREFDIEASRKEAVRFALFWYLCVWNDDKAASWCFRQIKEKKAARVEFPGADLYRLLIENKWGEACAYPLISAKEFTKHLSHDESPVWRTDKERFGEDASRAPPVCAHWWWHGQKLLPWLQRDYLRQKFPDYAPLTDHEDDVPYDDDHICPYNDWGKWTSVRDRFEDEVQPTTQQRMRDGRDSVGDRLGNRRLVEASRNRHDGDADVAKKFPFVLCEPPFSVADRHAMANWAFAPEHCELWKRVSRRGKLSDRRWNNDRLAALQQVVEQRATWLYRRFYDDLGYADWSSA